MNEDVAVNLINLDQYGLAHGWINPLSEYERKIVSDELSSLGEPHIFKRLKRYEHLPTCLMLVKRELYSRGYTQDYIDDYMKKIG